MSTAAIQKEGRDRSLAAVVENCVSSFFLSLSESGIVEGAQEPCVDLESMMDSSKDDHVQRKAEVVKMPRTARNSDLLDLETGVYYAWRTYKGMETLPTSHQDRW